MSKFAVRRGHQRTGTDGCAQDILNEIDVANEYYIYVIRGLRSLGHEVIDVTPPENNRTLSDSLSYGVNMATVQGVDYFISCHANSSVRSENPIGCEVIYMNGSAKGKQLATDIDKELAKLGFKDRGAKADVRGLSELRNTKCPCVIVEPFFISSQADVDLWKKIGAKALGYAIVKGITGESVISQGWSQNSSGWVYYKNDNTCYKNQWAKIEDKWYLFNSLGYLRTNQWWLENDEWYYLKDNGEMISNNWLQYKNQWYYFDEHGCMIQNDWVKSKNEWYFFDNTGIMVTDKIICWKEKNYYLNSLGVMLSNSEITINNKKYTIDPSGIVLQYK